MATPVENWRSVVERLDSRPGLAARLAENIRKAGKEWEQSGKAPGLVVESEAYLSWKSDVEAMIANVYRIANQLDGQAIPSPGGADYATQYERAIRRLRTARAAIPSSPLVVLADVYLEQQKELPREPRRYIDAYYESPKSELLWWEYNLPKRPKKPTNGELELALRQALDAAEQWLAMQKTTKTPAG